MNPKLEILKSLIGKDASLSPSSFGRWLHGKLIAADEGTTTVEFVVRKEMTNPVGMLHGGVMAGMFDDCMGVTFFGLGLEYFYPTVTLNVEYFKSCKEGETVYVTCNVQKQGRTVINIKGELRNTHNDLLAMATSNFVLSQIKMPF